MAPAAMGQIKATANARKLDCDKPDCHISRRPAWRIFLPWARKKPMFPIRKQIFSTFSPLEPAGRLQASLFR
jgi:hypothetical protein